MRSLYLISAIITLALSCFSCSPYDELEGVEYPEVETGSLVENISATTAEITSVVNDDGGGDMEVRGVVWSRTNINCELSDSDGYTEDGKRVGEYTSQLEGLSKTTTYFVRAYAKNNKGITYGTATAFSTLNYINVIYPTGGENWPINTNNNIRWSNELDDMVRIELWKGNSLLTIIADQTDYNEDFSWRVTDR